MSSILEKLNPIGKRYYALSSKELNNIQPDYPIQLYASLEPVTRSNFTAFLIRSFAISANDYMRQKVWFEWIMANIKFDYKKTFINFLSVGGWTAFSDSERQLFLREFEARKKHINPSKFQYKELIELFKNSPASTFNGQIEEMLRTDIDGFLQANINLTKFSESKLIQSANYFYSQNPEGYI